MTKSCSFLLSACLSWLLALTVGFATGGYSLPAFSAVPAQPRTLKTATFVYSLAFSPDGNMLASGGADNIISLWDVKTGKLLRKLVGHKDAVSSLVFSRDGHLLSASWDKSIKLWDPGSGEQLRDFSGHSDRVAQIILSSDEKKIASASDDTTVKLWDLESGKELSSLSTESGVSCVALSPDGNTLYTGDGDGKIIEWYLQNSKAKRTLRNRERDLVSSLALSPDGTTLIAGCNWDIVYFNTATGKELRRVDSEDRPWGLTRSMVLSPDGKTVAAAGADKAITFFAEATGAELKSLWEHTEEIDALALSPDGNTLASGSQDYTIKLWDVAWTKGAQHPINLHPKLPPLPAGVSRLRERDGVAFADIRYVKAETKRDLLLEKAIRLNGWCSGEDEDSVVKYAYNKIDLNGDGLPEALVFVYGPGACGSGGCRAIIATPRKNRYKIVGFHNLVSTPIIVSKSSTRSWKDLVYCSRYGYFLSKWNGTNYENTQNLVPPYTALSGTALIADKEVYKSGFKIEAPKH